MNNDLISRSELKKAFEITQYNDYDDLKRTESLIDNAPTVEIATKLQPNCNKLQQPQGERYERALAIIDRLRTDGHINNKEQGTLRRAILLPERPQGEWVKVKEERMSVDMSGDIVTRYKCSKCGRVIATFPSKLAGYYPFCHCGAKMKGGAENGCI